MNIPKEIYIAGIPYEIEETKNLEYEHGMIGQIIYMQGKIKIEKKLSKERKEQTLIHEILHGIFYEAGYEEQEEEMINRVGIVLYQVLKDNPVLFENEENGNLKDEIEKLKNKNIKLIREMNMKFARNTNDGKIL